MTYTELASLGSTRSRFAIERMDGAGYITASIYGADGELVAYFDPNTLDLAKRRELAKALLDGEPLDPIAYRYVLVEYTPTASIVSTIFGRDRLYAVLDRETGELASFGILRDMAATQAVELNAKPDRRRWIMFMPADAAKDVVEL